MHGPQEEVAARVCERFKNGLDREFLRVSGIRRRRGRGGFVQRFFTSGFFALSLGLFLRWRLHNIRWRSRRRLIKTTTTTTTTTTSNQPSNEPTDAQTNQTKQSVANAQTNKQTQQPSTFFFVFFFLVGVTAGEVDAAAPVAA